MITAAHHGVSYAKGLVMMLVLVFLHFAFGLGVDCVWRIAPHFLFVGCRYQSPVLALLPATSTTLACKTFFRIRAWQDGKMGMVRRLY
jgi:hypothetical protein